MNQHAPLPLPPPLAPSSTIRHSQVLKAVGLPDDYATLTFSNVDESKNKRGSQLNTFEGGYNVSYFTCRGYKDQFDGLASESTGDHIVFFGLQYLIKE